MSFPPFPSDLPFGSYFVYPNPQAIAHAVDDSAARACRNLILLVKRDAVSPEHSPQTLIRVWIERLARTVSDTPLASLLDGTATLIPMPRSSAPLPKSVWPALQIADALVEHGLGAETLPCLKRTTPVPKAAFSEPGERPTPLDHYNSLGLTLLPGIPERVILIDDVITQGAMFSGAFARLTEVAAEMNIFGGFAFARTVPVFDRAIAPCVGRITCSLAGDASSRTP
jgi:hypothetical protein